MPPRSLRRTLAVAACVIAAGIGTTAQGQQSLEYPIKAAFLYKFAEFVVWPQSAAGDQFDVCIVGVDPFGKLIDQVLNGARAGGKPVVLHRIPKLDPAAKCHVAFLGGSPEQSRTQAIAAVQGTPILTVTDSPASAAERGIIHFLVRDNRVRFSIDAKTAAESGLGVSSMLLDIAVR